MAIGQFCCSVCGSREFKFSEVLWDGLTDEWQICEEERRYIDRQQGEQCIRCGSNLRSIALADGLRNVFSTDKTLSDFVASASSKASILEINEAGTLHSLLMKLPGHVFAEYPRVDMHALPFDAESFDVVVHSDTLEHVKNPVHALQECGRVLKTGGALCFTIPIIVGRMSRSRDGLKPSYHGDPALNASDYLVHTEFGADAWTYIMRAGFSQLRIFAVEYPAAISFVAIR
ncbi:class I SAM-dependent methyltransferase [Rhizobium leguminosarum]|uniref:Methyltransferase domain family protein n=1 Tax=Rhizobium leguminosarum TaxID=384 RepID=A0A2Z4YLA6_RHILE|nr:methyltransferase domain-containing protein [Rhizobium leguminosarum]ASS54324.1 SAM-dependent methyltransferase [Rhizobium leguminosarum bv. viciae]AXA41378.1 Methyltransferase domain family protein [Rhizobium leguminosarum]MBB4333227.1 SAM-dependent methyltransferase [Rhizobium leguminosarum]MBB4346171.1 SAM-dependent methyltransferase [Rhizobium leguminosarum]MBB4358904.1 SAM-dependent methyltransferase [Rhizobium leguminosarum]